MTENICTSAGKGNVVNIETGFLYTCNETCEMNASAVCNASQNLEIVSLRPVDVKGSHAMFAPPSSGGVKQNEENQHIPRACGGA